MTFPPKCPTGGSGRRERQDPLTSARRPPAGRLGHTPILPVDDSRRAHTSIDRGRRSKLNSRIRYEPRILVQDPRTAVSRETLDSFESQVRTKHLQLAATRC